MKMASNAVVAVVAALSVALLSASASTAAS
jgi:hypothetical protein